MTEDEIYRQNIERLMLTGSSEVISNSLPQHAAALLACFFSNAKAEIKILCTTLGRQVYDAPEVLSSMLAATQRIPIQIIVRGEPEAGSEFLRRFQEQAKSHPTKLVLETNAELRSDLIKRVASNFAVMDQKAFRWEQDCKDVKAVACMNLPSVAAKLSGMFDRLCTSIRPNGAPALAAR
jgi:pyruvate-formate lyase-activating enzyme